MSKRRKANGATPPPGSGKLELGREGIVAIALMVWARKGLAAGTAASLMLILAAITFSLEQRYTAEAMLVLPSVSLGKLGENASVSAVPDLVVLRTEVDILRSDAISRQVIDELGLANEPEFEQTRDGILQSFTKLLRASFNWLNDAGSSGSAPRWTEAELRNEEILGQYKRRLSIFNDGRSSTAYVGFWAQDPRLAARVANSHVAGYLRGQVERRTGAQQLAIGWLRHELESREGELKAAQIAVQSFRAENGLVLTNADVRQSTVDQELAQLNQQLAVARGDVALADARLKQLQPAANPGGSLRGTSDMINAPVLLKLREREAEAKLALARLESSFQPTSPGFNAAKGELATVQTLIGEELARTRQSLAADLSAAEARLALLEKQVDAAKQRKLKLDSAQIELSAREAVAASKRSVYDTVLRRFDLLLAEQRFNATDARIISAASVPTQPSYPRTALYLMVALLVSMAAGIGLAYVAERMKGDERSPRLADARNPVVDLRDEPRA